MFGLYYSDVQRLAVSLPLLSVRAEASIKELAAHVNLTQTYRNDATFPIEGKYSFPVPARAAVSSFVMVKQDGTRVVGSVLEKMEARKTYEAAVAEGQLASLMEQATPDVFQIALGNIPPYEQVQIELVYATELSEDEESDSIRFHLPVHIGARYGRAPAEFTGAPSSGTPFITITANVEALAPISKIASPSHAISTEMGPDPALPNSKDLPLSNYARVSLSSDTALDKDFVLTIKSAGLDAPRCIAELHPTNDTAALALTFVPRFALPDLARQEFILLVDRSGSMEGARIAAARKALVVLLRALPAADSLLQILSFGWDVSALWPAGSRAYNQATLEEATRHVDGMGADYGGTEIANALANAFAGRARDRPTSVLVLTDGDAWDLDGVLDTVKRAVEDAPEGAPLRVSVLGIGNAVSTAMCEGIARVGHGSVMLVDEQETSFAGKVARLLRAARTPVISNITVDWGRAVEAVKVPVESRDDDEIVKEAPNTENKTLNVFDVNVDPTLLDRTKVPPASPVILPPPAAVQQSPYKIRNLFPGTRVNVYALLQGQSVPQNVTLRGSTPDGAEIALTIPVTVSRLPRTPALHALAARKLIQDLEDGQHAAIPTDDADLLARTVRAHIVRLGTTYQISSTHTSFVAVDETRPRVRFAPAVLEEEEDRVYMDQIDVGEDALLMMDHDELDPGNINIQAQYSMPQPRVSQPRYRKTVNTHSYNAPPAPARFTDTLASYAHRLGSAAFGSRFAYFMPAPNVPTPVHQASESSDPPPPEFLDPLEAFARLQTFDGAFPSSHAVLALVSLRDELTLADVHRALGFPAADDDLVGTLLALAFLRLKTQAEDGGADGEAWTGMYEKAREWVGAAFRDGHLATESVREVEARLAAMLEV
ncbi:von Willebrand factor type A domain-containing protein [Mycena vitilis]|nr:von Willebrand factor type A domain-containing protein [Mycena vitilis]